MGNYKTTRKEAAEQLDISVRSVDRYIKAWKLRAKKKGKIVYVHTDDIVNISGNWWDTQHVIVTEMPESNSAKDAVLESTQVESTGIVKKSEYDKLTKTFEKVYTDLRTQIEKKDDIIQKLSVEVWRKEEEIKHSISVSEHNRSQMLLEESRGHIAKQMSVLSEEKKGLEWQLKNEKFDKKVLIVFVFVLLAIAAYFWFKSV